MKKTIQTIVIRIGNFFKTLFVNGLITVLPLLLTIAIINMLFKFIKNLLEPVKNLIMSSSQFIPSWLQWIPHIEIVIAILLILLLGTVLNIFVFKSMLLWIEQWLSKIPLVNPIYSGMKQLVKAFGQQEKNGAQQVVLVKFPHEHMHTVGFVTGQVPAHLAPKADTEYMSVYVPTTPNPTGGFYLIVAKDDLIPLNINRQEAMTLIMSVGMVQPKQQD
jgi:uncharacterized membrane protein